MILGVLVSASLFFTTACGPPLYCGDVQGLSYHQDTGSFITPEDISGRWYVIGTTMEPNGSTWSGGECPRQYFEQLSAPEGQAIFTENGTWINPTGGFSGINTMPDITEPYNMVFTKPDSPFASLLETQWTLYAMGSEPAEYMALYFCRPWANGVVHPFLQGGDILARTQDPDKIAEIERKVLALAEGQGIFIDNYVPLNQQGCEPIDDFEN
jgi:hypothetical protein